ncbi:unnamed protein product [Paramecium pentaurelia]|uniref:Uncharacterized protein n=1 Tax=Paramecium pentaurelia TaxID=43138 RepID=A0A8S1XWB8_9CILI|nr:unnamed protein product [Paramecium pentaurelia]
MNGLTQKKRFPVQSKKQDNFQKSLYNIYLKLVIQLEKFIIFIPFKKQKRKSKHWNDDIEFKFSGGGEYDKQGTGQKMGRWVELSEHYCDNFELTYHGEYKNGKKFGRWDICYNNGNGDQIIGGGLYNEGTDDLKIGKWIDLSDRFCRNSYVIYQGEYLNGQRVGKWDIWFKEDGDNKQNIRIGGGSYDEQETGMKTGSGLKLVIVLNKILKQLKKGNIKMVGNLVDGIYITIREMVIKLWEYKEGGDNIKIGQWIDISDGFCRECQVTYKGEYKIGKRVGKWDILYKDLAGNNESIGGGSYDEKGDGMKIGKWIDLDDRFCDSKQITYKGQYKNGKKQGLWVEIDIQKNKQCSEMKYHNYYQYHN